MARVGEHGLNALLLLNPADIFRILNVFSLDDAQRLYGLASILPPAMGQVGGLTAAMLAWIAGPLLIASWRFRA